MRSTAPVVISWSVLAAILSGVVSKRSNLSEELPAFRTRIVHSAGQRQSRDLGHVFAVLAYITAVIDQLILQVLPDVRRDSRQTRHAVDHVDREMEAVDLVAHAHIERRGGGAFFFISAHVQLLVGAPVGQPVNQPGIAVIVEDDRLVAVKRESNS